jgi:hypothetical protein
MTGVVATTRWQSICADRDIASAEILSWPIEWDMTRYCTNVMPKHAICYGRSGGLIGWGLTPLAEIRQFAVKVWRWKSNISDTTREFDSMTYRWCIRLNLTRQVSYMTLHPYLRVLPPFRRNVKLIVSSFHGWVWHDGLTIHFDTCFRD